MGERLVVTGASGYIGARLVALARARGCVVVALGSPAHPWRLGKAVPPGALEGARAVIHLAQSWAADRTAGPSEDNVNLTGTVALARATLAAGSRFVFASTNGARPQARNAYGRIKHMTEERLRSLANDRVVCARIGLVYGGRERGQYGVMCRLAGLPVLPMIGLSREVQPIHLDEVCEGLLRLALEPPAGRDTVVLAGAPMTFGGWLKTLRRARLGRTLRLVPVPLRLALLACDATRLVPFLPTVDRERVLGLASAAPMASDVAALGLLLRDPATALAQSPAARRRLIGEAAALLAYAAGRPVRSPAAIMMLTRALVRDDASRTALPGVAVRWPVLLRLFEPLRPSMRHALSRRLHLAAMVAESLPGATPPPSLARVAGEIALDLFALPFRLALNRTAA